MVGFEAVGQSNGLVGVRDRGCGGFGIAGVALAQDEIFHTAVQLFRLYIHFVEFVLRQLCWFLLLHYGSFNGRLFHLLF